MNKGTKKATSYFVLALYMVYTLLPEAIKHWPAATWLVGVSSVVACLWRARDYITKGDLEDLGDNIIGVAVKKEDVAIAVIPGEEVK